MPPELSILPIWPCIRSRYRSTASPPYRSQLLLAADLRFRVRLSLVQLWAVASPATDPQTFALSFHTMLALSQSIRVSG